MFQRLEHVPSGNCRPFGLPCVFVCQVRHVMDEDLRRFGEGLHRLLVHAELLHPLQPFRYRSCRIFARFRCIVQGVLHEPSKLRLRKLQLHSDNGSLRACFLAPSCCRSHQSFQGFEAHSYEPNLTRVLGVYGGQERTRSSCTRRDWFEFLLDRGWLNHRFNAKGIVHPYVRRWNWDVAKDCNLMSNTRAKWE